MSERIELRSYARQGIGKTPTVHMGPAVTQMEKRGMRTNVGDLNRDIAAHNTQRRRLPQNMLSVARRLDDLVRRRKEAAALLFPNDEPRDLPDMLLAYPAIR